MSRNTAQDSLAANIERAIDNTLEEWDALTPIDIIGALHAIAHQHAEISEEGEEDE